MSEQCYDLWNRGTLRLHRLHGILHTAQGWVACAFAFPPTFSLVPLRLASQVSTPLSMTQYTPALSEILWGWHTDRDGVYQQPTKICYVIPPRHYWFCAIYSVLFRTGSIRTRRTWEGQLFFGLEPAALWCWLNRPTPIISTIETGHSRWSISKVAGMSAFNSEK